MRTQRGPGHHRMGLKPLPGSKARLRSVTATAQSFHGPLELTRRLERRQEGRGVPEPRPPSPSGLAPHPGGVSPRSETLLSAPRVPRGPQASLPVPFPLGERCRAGSGGAPRRPSSWGRSGQSCLSGLQNSGDQGLPLKEGPSLSLFLKAGLHSLGAGRGPGLEAI